MTAASHRFLPLAVPQVAQLAPYVPGKPLDELAREWGIVDAIKLASNENPFGPGELARAAYVAAGAELGRYPDGGGVALRAAIAAHHGLTPAMVTLGNGSNDVLDLVARTFLGPGRSAVMAEYAFAVYPLATQAVGATARVAPARDFGHDLAALRAAIDDTTRVVWLANPNNPTGTWLAPAAVKAFVAALPPTCLCVLDEAYAEYVDDPETATGVAWLDEFPQLIVTRTFSKAHGLAALRVGYALSHPDLAALLNRVRQPFNVNAPAQAAASAALTDRAHLECSAAHNRTERARLTAGLTALGLTVVPSAGNFVMVDVGRPAAVVDQALLRQGVICRPLANYGLPRHLRITVGLSAETDRALAALRVALESA